MFDPKTNKFPYPDTTDKHYLKLKKNRGVVFDSDYPYVNTKKGFKFIGFLFRIFLVSIVFPVVEIRMGLKVKGKENIYPPVYDNTKRVDYYTHTYGVGYKGSK